MMESLNYMRKGQNLVISDDVKENTTVYYSNFKLFNDDSEMLFATYLSFKKNLQTFLGDDWENYAKKTIFNTIDGSTIFVQSRDVFGAALETWLELRKEINEIEDEKENPKQTGTNKDFSEDSTIKTEKEASMEKGFELENENTNNNQNNENQAAETEVVEEEKVNTEEISYAKDEQTENNEGPEQNLRGFETYQRMVREKFSESNINEDLFRAVIHAFYTSAIKVWKKTLANYSFNQGTFSFLEESKKFLLDKLQNVYKTKFKALKPILVATERIKDYIYSDTSKDLSKQAQNMDERDKRNIKNFSSSMQLENYANFNFPLPNMNAPMDEEQLLRESFKNLKIGSEEPNNSSCLGKRSATQARSVVEIKKFNKKFEKLLNQNMIEFAAHYVNNMTRTSNSDWQISRSFVTSMVEVNYNKLLQMENRLLTKADDIKNDVRIRFIQPAQGFYNRLMEVWIIAKTKSLSKDVLFSEYLEKVKVSLGNVWNDKFMTATHNFFMTLYYEWHLLKQIENNTEEKVLIFVKKVKENMMAIWEDTIVKKVEELSNRQITPSTEA